MSGEGPDREALRLVLPFLLWGLAFVTLYAAHGFACSVGVRPDHLAGTTRIVLGVLLLAFLLAHAWLAHAYWRRWREGPCFVRLAGFALALAATATTAWTGSPVLYLGICS